MRTQHINPSIPICPTCKGRHYPAITGDGREVCPSGAKPTKKTGPYTFQDVFRSFCRGRLR